MLQCEALNNCLTLGSCDDRLDDDCGEGYCAIFFDLPFDHFLDDGNVDDDDTDNESRASNSASRDIVLFLARLDYLVN